MDVYIKYFKKKEKRLDINVLVIIIRINKDYIFIF